MSASPRNHSRSVSPPRSPRNRDERSPVHSSSPRGAEYDREPRGEEVHNPGSNLYISGLSTRTSEEDLRAKFSKCGKVIECSLVRDRDGNPRGFGFVRMETVEQADAAIADLNREEMNGYQLRVEKAKRARPRDPTPGRYLGNDRSRYPRARSDRSYGDRYSGGDRYSSGGDRYGGDRYDDRYRGSYGSSSSSSTSGGGGDRYDDRYRGSYSSGGDRYGGDRYDDRYRGSYAPAYDHAPRPEYSRSSRYQPYERRSPPAYRRSRSGSR